MRNKFEEGLLRYLTAEQLEKLQKTKIGIAGLGGLGSNIANILVRTGFVDFELLDDDIIETSNLNRQNYFYNEIGKSKVVVSAKRMKQVNPDVCIRKNRNRLTKDNVQNFFTDRDIIFEAFDNVKSKSLILEYFGNTNKLLIFGNGMSGIVGGKIIIDKMNENLYFVGDGITEASETSPPLAPRVVQCASLMASVAMEKVLL